MIAAEALKYYTPEEFAAMEKDEHFTYELIDGIVLMSPRPAAKHQKVSLNLASALLHQLKSKNCDIVQEVDLVLEDNHFIPDIMITCGEKFEGQRHTKPPLIVIEIVSPSNASHDYIIKHHKYEQLGIQEYWIVSPEEKCIWVIYFEHQERVHYCNNRQAQSIVMPELHVSLEDIFE